jgi:hypothetical protein
MKELLIGGGIGVSVIWLILFFAERISNVQQKKTARKAFDKDQISFELPSVGYDSSGRHLSTKLEALVEADEIENLPLQISDNLQKKIDTKGKRRSKETRYRICG